MNDQIEFSSSDDDVGSEDSDDLNLYMDFSLSSNDRKVFGKYRLRKEYDSDENDDVFVKSVKKSDLDYYLTSSDEDEAELDDEEFVDRVVMKERKRRTVSARDYSFPFSIVELKNCVDPYHRMNSSLYKKLSSDFSGNRDVQTADRHFQSGMFEDSQNDYKKVVDKHNGGVYYRTQVLFSKSLEIYGRGSSVEKMEIISMINRCDYELTHPQIGEESDYEMCVPLLSFVKAFLYLKLEKFMISRLELQKILMEEHCDKVPNMKTGIKKNIEFLDGLLSKEVDPIVDLQILEPKVDTSCDEEDGEDEDDTLLDDLDLMREERIDLNINRHKRIGNEEEEEDDEGEDEDEDDVVEVDAPRKRRSRRKKRKKEVYGKKVKKGEDNDMRELEKILNSKFVSKQVVESVNKKELYPPIVLGKEDINEEEKRGREPEKRYVEDNDEDGDEEREERNGGFKNKMVEHFYSWCKIKISEFDDNFPNMRSDLERIDRFLDGKNE